MRKTPLEAAWGGGGGDYGEKEGSYNTSFYVTARELHVNQEHDFALSVDYAGWTGKHTKPLRCAYSI